MAIGTVATIAGLAATAATTTMSFAEANKQKNLSKQAQIDAEKAMDQARKQLGVNYMEGLGINKDAYEQERNAMLSVGATQADALREMGPQGLGRLNALYAQQQQGQQGVRTAQEQAMLDRQKLIASEDAKHQLMLANLDLSEAAGAQQLVADANKNRAAAMTQGFQGLTSLGAQALSAAKLYPNTKDVKTVVTPEAPIAQIKNSPLLTSMNTPNTFALPPGYTPNVSLSPPPPQSINLDNPKWNNGFPVMANPFPNVPGLNDPTPPPPPLNIEPTGSWYKGIWIPNNSPFSAQYNPFTIPGLTQ